MKGVMGVDVPEPPDKVDAPDAADVLQGLVGIGLATGSSSASGIVSHEESWIIISQLPETY
jgi:hypothetical protein